MIGKSYILNKVYRYNFLPYLKTYDLAILDDLYPSLRSGFRIAEYNSYLQAFSQSQVFTTSKAFKLVGEKRYFYEVLKDFEKKFPSFKNKVSLLVKKQKPKARLFYTLFLNNAVKFIEYAEKLDSDFAFTLYPGGGFKLFDKKCDELLDRIFSYQNFKKVIVTQKKTYDYLIDNFKIENDLIAFIYGVILNLEKYENIVFEKKFFGLGKNSLDICFVAYKYSNDGSDKGFDLFCKVAEYFTLKYENINFHVVGNFNQDDIWAFNIKRNFYFYGIRDPEFFPDFYKKMDIILSPNEPFILSPGAFDGFPTSCCVEAGKCGVLMMCTDHLGQNIHFENHKDMIIIEKEFDQVVDIIETFYNNPELIYQIGKKGSEKISTYFSNEAQLEPRKKVLQELICK